jgi:hypothetical protein
MQHLPVIARWREVELFGRRGEGAAVALGTGEESAALGLDCNAGVIVSVLRRRQGGDQK